MEHILSDDIGGRLRRARECRGLSLADAARLTKLSVSVLQAIERNDFTRLPGGMFRKAYVRTLATEFGLNPNEIAADYCARFEPPVEPTAVLNHDSAEEKWVRQLTPSPQRSIVTLAAIAAPAIAWFMLQSGSVAAKVPLDAAFAEYSAMPMARAASVALTAAPLRIEIAATDWCWVAADTDGTRVMYRLVEPGERVVLEGQHTIGLRLGNAGAVTLSINGAPSRSFGGDNEVVELKVTPDDVEAGTTLG
jgi:transcriptional regulator with XRE-family HTH domain